MVTKIAINLELGHVAKTLEATTRDGHTHEWIVFVRGADGMVIEHFVEKVVFWLHDSYDPPKCVVKQSPYQVKQSGYAGFNILIDIHFKNKSEPKTVRFHYDLFLHKENMPPVNHTRVEMLTFTNPAEDFKKRLLKAGGIVQIQEAQPKQKKPHKDIRHTEEKPIRSSKEKYESEKPRSKHRPDNKPLKVSGKSEEKRRSSVSEAEPAKKRKQEDRSSATSHHGSSERKSKEKDKVGRLKMKMENPSAGLFSREESIDIKQLKKRESTREDARKEKEKRQEIKIKTEAVNKPEHVDRKRKDSPVLKKLKQSKEIIKKQRTVSSSSSEIEVVRKPVIFSTQSDSDSSGDIKKIKKQIKVEKIKKPMKRSKKTPDKTVKKSSVKSSYHEHNIYGESDLRKTPLHFEQSSNKTPKHHKSSEIDYDKKSKSVHSQQKSKVTGGGIKPNVKDVKKSVKLKKKKEKDKDSRSSTPVRKFEAIPKERSSVHISPHRRSKEKRLRSSSESSNSSEDVDFTPVKELTKSAVSPISSMSSSESDAHPPEIPSFNLPPEEHDDPLSASNEDPPSVSSDHVMNDSDVERDSYSQGTTSDHLEGWLEESNEDKVFTPEEPTTPKEATLDVAQVIPTVVVGVSQTLKYYPHMNEELFEEIKQMQDVLATVTDETKLRKITSIVRKSGNFTPDGEDMMDVDLCALDRKTINRLQRHLKPTAGK